MHLVKSDLLHSKNRFRRHSKNVCYSNRFSAENGNYVCPSVRISLWSKYSSHIWSDLSKNPHIVFDCAKGDPYWCLFKFVYWILVKNPYLSIDLHINFLNLRLEYIFVVWFFMKAHYNNGKDCYRSISG